MKIHGALRVLEKKEMYNIHQAVIEVLHNPGIKLENQQALEQLNEKGVKVDFDSQIVKLEPYMIEETIRQLIGSDSLRITPNGVDAPEEISYIPDLLKPSSIGYMCATVYDLKINRMRYANHQDIIDFIKLGEALNLDYIGTAVVSKEVPSSVASIHSAAIMAKFTHRPGSIEPDTLKDMPWIGRIFEVAGLRKKGVPFATYVSTKSPLTLGGRAAEILMYQSEQGILTYVSGMPMTGATTPATLASTLVIHLAEHFGFNTVARLLCKPPHNKISRRSISFAPCFMDMRRGNFFISSPEADLLHAAFSQICGEFYKLPVIVGAGMYVDAKEPGIQATQEKCLKIMNRIAFPGYSNKKPHIGLVGSLGALNSNLTVSKEQVILDYEIIQYVNRFLKGFKVNEDTLAVDIIRKVGPGGNFLGENHTLDHYKDELWFPELSHRGPWDSWVKDGRRSPLDLAREKVNKILSKELSPVLSDNQIKEIDRLVVEAEKEILGKPTGIIPGRL